MLLYNAMQCLRTSCWVMQRAERGAGHGGSVGQGLSVAMHAVVCFVSELQIAIFRRKRPVTLLGRSPFAMAAGCFSRAASIHAAFLPVASFRYNCIIKHVHTPGRPLCARHAATAGTSPLAEPAPKFAALPAEQQRQVDAYLDLLLDWNQRMNLTGR